MNAVFHFYLNNLFNKFFLWRFFIYKDILLDCLMGINCITGKEFNITFSSNY